MAAGFFAAVSAFSRSGDPATGDFGDAKLIRKFGEVLCLTAISVHSSLGLAASRGSSTSFGALFDPLSAPKVDPGQ
ncbi:hypothetical protein [Bradyrhizobium brasilense]|uniref:hypothetical protein n=1 Tax=Bradyrhizobium brasilense TaxID=1419277 RepID=UPI0011600AF2|nr:hypothetical protein [Bradyrhizobium brasilense]